MNLYRKNTERTDGMEFDEKEKQARFAARLSEVFRANGLEKYINDTVADRFYALTERMLSVNAVMNLTALDTADKIIPLHYADCALVADRFPAGATVADIGCGGGFPTFPLAILRPDLRITAIDSTGKKIRYVEETAHLLGLDGIRAVTARAEELGKDKNCREAFDTVVSRAVARLEVLDELCLPLCRVGGTVLFLKGAAGEAELTQAREGIRRLGGGEAACEEMTLHTAADSEMRTVITVSKQLPTPAEFPRQFGQIKKRPLK